MAKSKSQQRARQSHASSLAALSLFQGLPSTSLRALEKHTQVLHFQPGHFFFRPGERGQVLYFLEAGQVQTFRTSHGKKLIIAELKPPAVFGEMGCVGHCLYHCSAQATRPSRVRTLSRVQLDALLLQFPLMTRRLLDLVSERFVELLLDLEATSFLHLIPRLARLLLNSATGACISGLTHKEIAEHLRVYRESVTAALGELRKAGIIAVNRKQILILDQSRLERAARE